MAAAAFVAGGAQAADPLLDAVKSADRRAALALLSEGADVRQTEPDGTTALHWAVYHDDVELIERLLAAGAAVSMANDYGATPMSEAAVRANPEVLERLLAAGADVDSPNAEGQTALMVVARTDNVDAARLLLDHGASVNARETRKGQTALMWAAAQRRPGMVQLLIERGADVSARSASYPWERRVTAEPRTKYVPSGGFTPLLYSVREGCLDCARMLLDAGAEIDMTDPDGITPLLSALLNAHFDTARLLLERGADPNKWDRWGRAPLYTTVDYNTLPVGGRPDRPSLAETGALDMARRLLDAGANPNAQLKLFPPYRSLRMDRGADVLLDIGTTPLLRAARAADLPAMTLLLERGALVDLPQQRGATPLMAAVAHNARDTRGRFKTEDQSIEAARLLLDAGADVNARDAQGRTALHTAASLGHNELVALLAARGADLTAADTEGRTPVDAAMGELAGRRRTADDAHEDTANLLRELIAASASGAPPAAER